MLRSRFGAIGVFAALATSAAAQCTNTWLPGTGLGGTNGEVHALTRWDPDGPGPHHEVMVIGGTAVAIPNATALVGVVAHQQVIAAELDAQGAITALTALTSTNALTATVGVF